MSSNKAKDEPELDPYDVLGVQPDASDNAISKAYKKMALKLHPDKQVNLSPSEAEQVAKKFHNVKEARAFLLDPEHQEARTKYDAKRASIQRRKQQEAARQVGVSERNKRFREELKAGEEEALKAKKRKSSKSTGNNRTNRKQDDELIDKLRQEGKSMREEKAKREEEAAAAMARQQARSNKQDRKEKERLLQSRQVRLKWSRKKMDTSPSEHSLATLLSKKYGTVEEVEMIGSKGNLALITFEFPSSCRPCVAAYKNSEEMRAFFVGKRKEEEEAMEASKSAKQEQDNQQPRSNQRRDEESLSDRKLRQTEERARLLREMEAEEVKGQAPSSAKEERDPTDITSRCVSVAFPIMYQNLTPIQKLEKAEADILGKILSDGAFASLQALQT